MLVVYESLYGLKQALRVWYKLFREYLEKKELKTEACVGVKWVNGDPCFISFYVDDLIIYAPNLQIIDNFKQIPKSTFKMNVA